MGVAPGPPPIFLSDWGSIMTVTFHHHDGSTVVRVYGHVFTVDVVSTSNGPRHNVMFYRSTGGSTWIGLFADDAHAYRWIGRAVERMRARAERAERRRIFGEGE